MAATMQQSEGGSREIRVALVLYGGVSLAIYENGVTRSFFDLVKGSGIFRVLLTLLDAEAKVDVIAGTSAGGINGLMLAAALESGAEFKKTADLWREHGDFGTLLRRVSEADKATSLLKGESYYRDKLTEAFKDLTQPDPDYESPGEIDVFITGTDLYGYTKTTYDSSRNKIEDKAHRTLFQLKHRPGRKHLGLNGETKDSGLAELQAVILASIARITSTFPVAFPPFQIEQVPDEHREEVSKALQRNSGIEGDRVYVDGGVLDNKPFGPAIRAIFYRMPTKPVDRRLFYVEPDPQQFTRVQTYRGKETPNPAFVVWSALSTIPSHESIFEDLEKLLEHNARIHWLSDLKKEALKICEERELCVAEDSLERKIYRNVRIDSLAKALLLKVDEVPTASHAVSPERSELYKAMKDALTPKEDSILNQKQIDDYDIDYQLRRAFHFLYHFYKMIENQADGGSEEQVSATKVIGRVIKTLKLIRDALYLLRDEVAAVHIETDSGSSQEKMHHLINLFSDFLDVEFSPWRDLNNRLEAAAGADLLSLLAERDKGPLSTEVLSHANQSARDAIEQLKGNGVNHFRGATLKKSILVSIEEALMKALDTCCHTDEIFSDFSNQEAIFFPLEFASGIHELDQIEVVRISPRDAKEGLGRNIESAARVSGDDLAHFAAFLRRDWRSNDILWGRLDGICQIIQSFLDEEAMEKIIHRREQLSRLIDLGYLKQELPSCPEHYLVELEQSWKRFLEAAATHSENPNETEAAYEKFRKQMILAGQQDAVSEDLRQVYFDHYFQEITWGRCCKPLPSVPSEHPAASIGSRVKSFFSGCRRLVRIGKSKDYLKEDASSNAIMTAANLWADESMHHVKDAGETFRGIGLGSQTVLGENRGVPSHILGQYVSQAYLLLWGVLHQAMGKPRGKDNFLGNSWLRLFFRRPAAVVHHLILMMRREKVLFPMVFVGILAALIAAGLVGWFFVSYKWSLLILFAFGLLLLFSWICPERE